MFELAREIFHNEKINGAIWGAIWGATLGMGFAEVLFLEPRAQVLLERFSIEPPRFLVTVAVLGAISGAAPTGRHLRNQITDHLFDAEIACRMFIESGEDVLNSIPRFPLK